MNPLPASRSVLACLARRFRGEPRFAMFLVFTVSAAGAMGCNRKATREECEGMLEKYVDMTIEPSETQNLTAAQVAAVRDMKKAIRKSEPAFSRVAKRCEEEITKRTVTCAMKAQNANEWEACVQE